ncbi:MAG TPA: Gfo/Idh/MocA family oxidoreductase, partial [bacterium]|nr:Gfo/Idh/MocA family oxidoreductase [bacterium]
QLCNHIKDRIKITAVADVAEDALSQWKHLDETIQRYNSLEQMLTHAHINAVYICTPAPDHANQAVKALISGLHVLSAVPACMTIDECFSLIKTARKSDKMYMLAENYCYIPENKWINEQCHQGNIGEITYIRGAYIHDCKSLMFSGKDLTWRGELSRTLVGNVYPTHTIGPIAQWLDINKHDGDRFKSIRSFTTAQKSLAAYAASKFGNGHPYASNDFFCRGDMSFSLIETEKGRIIELIYDTHSNRPASKSEYYIQGTKACYISGRYTGESAIFWSAASEDAVFQNVNLPSDTYDPDLNLLRDFINAIETETPSPIGVLDAVTWSSIIPLSEKSINNNNEAISFPEF